MISENLKIRVAYQNFSYGYGIHAVIRYLFVLGSLFSKIVKFIYEFLDPPTGPMNSPPSVRYKSSHTSFH